MSQQSRLSRNSIHSAVAWFVPIVLSLVATPILVTALGVKEYGIYSLIVGILFYSFNLHFGRALTRYIASARGGDSGSLSRTTATVVVALVTAILGSALIYFTAESVVEVLAIESDYRPKSINAVRLSAFVVAAMVILNLTWSVLHGLELFKVFSRLSNGFSASLTIGSVIIAWRTGSFLDIISYHLFLSSIFIIAGFGYLLREKALRLFSFSIDVASLRDVLSYSLPIIGYQLIGNVVVLFERGMITGKLSAEALTFYVIPMNLAIHLHGLASSLSLSVLPFASTHQDDRQTLLATYEKGTRYLSWLMTGIVTVAIVFGNQLLEVWIGKEFAEKGTSILILGMLAFGIHSLSVVAFQIADATGRSSKNLFTTFIAGVVFIVTTIFLFDGMGLSTPAVGRILTALVWLTFMLWMDRLLRGEFGGRFFADIIIRIAPAAISAAVIGLLFQSIMFGSWFTLLIGGIASFAVYGVVSLSTRVIPYSELKARLKGLASGGDAI